MGENFVIAPGGGCMGFLIMVWFQYQVAGGEENAADFRILKDFFAGCGDDELMVRS